MTGPVAGACPRSPSRAVIQIAGNEWSDALRSRRAAVVLLLYIALAALTMNMVLSGLQRLEGELADALQISRSDAPGVVTRSLWESERFRRMVSQAVRDDRLVRDLFGTPPEVLAHGALSFFYTPLLVILLTAHRIAEERAAGSVRYVLTRASRLSWVLGKAIGQAGLLLLAMAMGAAAAWCVARFRTGPLQDWATAGGMLVWSLRAWVYALGFLGLGLGVSQLTRLPGLASAFGVLALIGLSILSWVADRYAGGGWGRLWEAARMLSPYAVRTDLWRSDPALFWPAVAQAAGLGACWLLAGYAAWRRRDA